MGMKSNQFAVRLEGQSRRILTISVPSQFTVEIGENFAYILIEVSYTVQRLEGRVTFGPKDFFVVSCKKHGIFL